MHVFVDALPHVPEHRRLPLLTQLVTTLGPSHFLWVLLMLLLKLHATHSAAKQSLPSASERVSVKDVFLCVSLCSTDALSFLGCDSGARCGFLDFAVLSV